MSRLFLFQLFFFSFLAQAEGPTYNFNFYNPPASAVLGPATQVSYPQGEVAAVENEEGLAQKETAAETGAEKMVTMSPQLTMETPKVEEKFRLLQLGSYTSSFKVGVDEPTTHTGVTLGTFWGHGGVWSSGLDLLMVFLTRSTDQRNFLSKLLDEHSLGLRLTNYWTIFRSRQFNTKFSTARLEIAPLLTLRHILHGSRGHIHAHESVGEVGLDLSLPFEGGKVYLNGSLGRGLVNDVYGQSSSTNFGLGLYF